MVTSVCMRTRVAPGSSWEASESAGDLTCSTRVQSANFWVQGGICIQAGAFGVQLARSGFGVKNCLRVFRQMIFRRQKCYISSIYRLANPIASVRQSDGLQGEEPRFLVCGWPAYHYPVRPGHTLDVTSRQMAMYSEFKAPSYKSWSLNFPNVWDERMQGQT